MSVRGNPAEIAARWKKRLDDSVTEIEAGVKRVTVAPGVKAAASADKFIQKITQSVNDGTWQKGVASVSLPDWQKAMIEKGIPRIRQGTASALPKSEKFFAALIPAIETAQGAIERMPSITFEDNLARAQAFMREMHKFNYKGA